MPTAVPPEALEVLHTFLDAGLRRDEPAMRACLTQQTLEKGQFDGSSPQNVRYEFGDASMEGESVVVPVKAYPLEGTEGAELAAAAAAAGAPLPAMEMPCVMVNEAGRWKLDLIATTERMFSGGIDAMMNQTAEALGTAMEGITEKLGDVMKEAFGGETATGATAAAQDWSTASLEIAPEELLPLPVFVPLPKVAAALSEACGSPVEAMAAMNDIMKIFDADERDTLFKWFNEQLFEGFGEMFTRINQIVPLKGRLRALRIENARNNEERLLVLDGSDLVYRMSLPNNAGYYGDDEIEGLLPGILAGLPMAPDPAVTGHRLIHANEEEANFAIYKERVVPRYMRRISDLVGGKKLALEAQWDDIYNPAQDGRQLYRWGLNRIYGAIALACLDAARQAQLSAELNAIHLIFGSNVAERFARFVDGTVTVSLYYYPGEVGCFYERDLDRVLAGEAIEYQEPAADEEEGDSAEDESAESDDADEDADKFAAMDDAAKAQALNDENFQSAAASLKENEPTWSMQFEMVFHRPMPMSLNFDSLQGDYSLVQPFIHQGMTATLEALTRIAFDPARKSFANKIQRVSISGRMEGSSVRVEISGGTLAVAVPLVARDVRPPTEQVLAALIEHADAFP